MKQFSKNRTSELQDGVDSTNIAHSAFFPKNITPIVYVLIFFIFSIGGAFIGLSSVIYYIFTPLAFLLGCYLFMRHEAVYLQFVVWLWIFTPFIRRITDFHTQYHSSSLVMLAPFVVSIICMQRFIKGRGSFKGGVSIAYAAYAITVTTAFLLGAVQNGFATALFSYLTWICPIVLGIYIITKRDDIEGIASAIFSSLSIGVLVSGAYGVIQFFILPSWDKAWIANSGMTSLGGGGIGNLRIFSTMNSPGVYALMLSAGLIATLSAAGRLKPVIASVGVAAFALTLVRSAWGGFLIAYLIVLVTAPIKKKIAYALMLFIVPLLCIPFLTLEPIASQVSSRVASISNLETDNSFQSRQRLFEEDLGKSLSTVVGSGLGSTGVATKLGSTGNTVSYDNGILDLFNTFGLFAVVMFFSLGYIVVAALKNVSVGQTPSASAAITIAVVINLAFSNILYAPTGIFLHIFAAIAIAYGARRTKRKLRN